MKLAIMQPYIFPYVGYFQLISSVDKFVIYDDVAYIKQGWINRNRILLNGKDHLFTLPLKGSSPNKLIRQICLHPELYSFWKEKFYKLLDAAYRRAPFYPAAMVLIKEALELPVTLISDLATQTIKNICAYTGIKTVFTNSATDYNNSHLHGEERVVAICKHEGASTYINAIGGKALYHHQTFNQNEIELRFLEPHIHHYRQFTNDFVPGLSTIDLLMFNPPEQVRQFFLDYTLIK